MPSTGLAWVGGLEVIYEVQVGTLAIGLTPLPLRHVRLPAGAVCSPGPELSGSSPGEKLDAGRGEEHDSAPRTWENSRFWDLSKKGGYRSLRPMGLTGLCLGLKYFPPA